MQANVVGFLNIHYSCAKKNETQEDLTLQRIIRHCFKHRIFYQRQIFFHFVNKLEECYCECMLRLISFIFLYYLCTNTPLHITLLPILDYSKSCNSIISYQKKNAAVESSDTFQNILLQHAV